MRREQFRHFADLRRCFRSADQVRVASGNPVVVFNICGNTHRLVCAVHYNTGLVFLLRFMTHTEYAKDRWKVEL
jgi:mRNA interferase HigB